MFDIYIHVQLAQNESLSTNLEQIIWAHLILFSKFYVFVIAYKIEIVFESWTKFN